jgi:hypothetical protein
MVSWVSSHLCLDVASKQANFSQLAVDDAEWAKKSSPVGTKIFKGHFLRSEVTSIKLMAELVARPN